MPRALAFGLVALLAAGAARAQDDPVLELIRETRVLSRDHVEAATLQRDAAGRVAVSVKLDAEGAAWLARVTRDNVGRALSLRLGERILARPIIRAPVEHGRLVISGLDESEAQALVKRLRPAP